MAKIDYNMPRPRKTTRPGVIPHIGRIPKPGTGRNKLARGYNPETKTWNQKG